MKCENPGDYPIEFREPTCSNEAEVLMAYVLHGGGAEEGVAKVCLIHLCISHGDRHQYWPQMQLSEFR